VDDTLLMNTPTAQEANKLKSILTDFVDALGTSLNLEKSQLFFFNTPLVVQTHISRLLGIPKSSLPSNYLGIPLMSATTRNISWDNLLAIHLQSTKQLDLSISQPCSPTSPSEISSSSSPDLPFYSLGSTTVSHKIYQEPPMKISLAWTPS
jgi:hypothetical protein